MLLASVRLRKSWIILCVSFIGMILVFAGCTGQRKPIGQSVTLYETGCWEEARLKLEVPHELEKKESAKDDRVLWRLEQGKILHDAGLFAESNLALEHAERYLRDFDFAADMSIKEEMKKAFGTQASGPYRGTPLEKVLIHTFMGLNWLAEGNLEEAGVQSTKAIIRQREAELHYRKEIQRAIEAGLEHENPLDVNNIMAGEDFRSRYSYLGNPRSPNIRTLLRSTCPVSYQCSRATSTTPLLTCERPMHWCR
jgi:hypothetical protein